MVGLYVTLYRLHYISSGTYFFSFLAVIFLEFWKRKQAIIAWEWDLVSVEEDELPLPQYEAKVKTTR